MREKVHGERQHAPRGRDRVVGEQVSLERDRLIAAREREPEGAVVDEDGLVLVDGAGKISPAQTLHRAEHERELDVLLIVDAADQHVLPADEAGDKS